MLCALFRYDKHTYRNSRRKGANVLRRAAQAHVEMSEAARAEEDLVAATVALSALELPEDRSFNDVCPICQCTMARDARKASLPCGHRVCRGSPENDDIDCYAALRAHVQRGRRMVCPLCRAPV
jgi:hypothetical protein